MGLTRQVVADGAKVELDVCSGKVYCSFAQSFQAGKVSPGYLARRWRFEQRSVVYKASYSKIDLIVALFGITKAHLKLIHLGFGELMAWAAPPLARSGRDGSLRIAARITALFALRPLLPWQTECLEVAALITRWYRCSGLPAKLVIGVRTTPFSMHAWCEVKSDVVSDASDVRKFYTVLYQAPDDP